VNRSATTGQGVVPFPASTGNKADLLRSGIIDPASVLKLLLETGSVENPTALARLAVRLDLAQ
jgi:hypothetical protein